MYQSIGYTTVYSQNHDRLFKIEILGETKSSYDDATKPQDELERIIMKRYEKVPVPETATYYTNKIKFLEAYDVYGNIITDENDMDYVFCREKLILHYNQLQIRYYKTMERGLDELRKDLFFNEIEMDISDYINNSDDDDDIYDNNITIYEKKRNKKINLSAFQKIYYDDGNVINEFYHVNGIKQGNCIVYNYFTNYIINYVNDKEMNVIVCKQ
jgi:hypothetical protein